MMVAQARCDRPNCHNTYDLNLVNTLFPESYPSRWLVIEVKKPNFGFKAGLLMFCSLDCFTMYVDMNGTT
jgi:hypothetical protein